MRDMKAVDVDTMSWEGLAAERTRSSTLSQHLNTGEETQLTATADNRARRMERSHSGRPDTTHMYATSAR